MIERLAALGPYFAADAHDAGVTLSIPSAFSTPSAPTRPEASTGVTLSIPSTPATPTAPATPATPVTPWRSMGELLDDPEVLAARVAAVRAYLAAASRMPLESVELRVAASVTQLGLAARTLSPLFALRVLGRSLAAPVSLRDLRWQPVAGSMFALSIPGLDRTAPLREGEAALDLEPLIVELCDIMRPRPFGVSPKVLRGNVASALHGACVVVRTAEPELASRARWELAQLLAGPTLTATAGATSGGRFQRRSCCLIYRAAPDRRGPVCGDCVLL